MTSILTSDVQTYVRELISKEFGSVDNEEKAPSENRISINREHQKQPQQSDVFGHHSQKYYNIIPGGIINETRNCREG